MVRVTSGEAEVVEAFKIPEAEGLFRAGPKEGKKEPLDTTMELVEAETTGITQADLNVIHIAITPENFQEGQIKNCFGELEVILGSQQ